MSHIYFIAPVRSDPDFDQKRRILVQIASDTACEFLLPLEVEPTPSFDLVRSSISDAQLVVADLSLERPSCYFELGIAEALSKAVFLIAKRGTTIHQIAIPDRVSWYSDLDEYQAIVLIAATQVFKPSKAEG